MRLTINASILATALRPLASIPPTKPANPAIGNIHLAVIGDVLSLSATDGSYRATRTVALAGEQTSGETLVPAKLLHDIVSKLSGDVTLEAAARLTIRCGRFKSELPCMEADQFPPWPGGQRESAFNIASSVLKGALSDVLPFAGKAQDAGMASWMHAVMLMASAPFLDVAAGTEKRIAWNRVDLSGDFPAGWYLIPSEYSKRLADALPDDDTAVVANRLGGTLELKWGPVQVITPLYALVAPNIQQLLPRDEATRVHLDSKELTRILASFAPLYTNDTIRPGVDFTGTGPLRLATVEAEHGQAEDEIGCNELTTPLDVRLELRNLTMALGVVGGGQEVVLHIDGKRPVVIADPRRPGVVVISGVVDKGTTVKPQPND